MSEPKHSAERRHRDTSRCSTDGRAETTKAQAPRRSTGRTQDFDRDIAARIRKRRMILGLTQWEFSDLLDVSPQQAQKYDRGTSRVSAGCLFRIAQVLNVGIDYFFEGLDTYGERPITEHARMCLGFARTVAQIPDRDLQEVLGRLVRTLASA